MIFHEALDVRAILGLLLKQEQEKRKIPVECFLNRVFPPAYYKGKEDSLIYERLFQPRKDIKQVKLHSPIDWDALDRKEDRNWRMQLSGMAMFHPIMNFFDERNDKNEIVKYFFDVCRDWLDSFGGNDPRTVTSRMPEMYTWYDMSVGFRALVIAFFLDRILFYKLNISEEEILVLSKIIEMHILNLSYEDAFSLNNHGMFQIQGLMALICLLGKEYFEAEYIYALDKMEALALSQYTEDGIHLEHSPHYHFYATQTFDSAIVSGWYDERKAIVDVVKKAGSAKKWLVDPKNRPACVGDSILTEQKNIDTSLNSYDRYKSYEHNEKIYYLSDFDSSGYSISRTPWDIHPVDSYYLLFMGMYQSKVHKHRDCLSFEWFDRGDKIICDSGKYGYKSDKYRHFFLSSRAHNSVEIEGFDIIKIKPYGSAIKSTGFTDGVINIEGELNYPAIFFNRKLYIKPGSWLIIVDGLKFQRARWAKQWLHFNKKYAVCSINHNKIKLKASDGKELIVQCLTPDITAGCFVGDLESMQGFISEKDYLYDENVAIKFEFHGKEKEIVTIIALDHEAYCSALHFCENKGLTEVGCDRFFEENKLPVISNVKHHVFDQVDKIKLYPKKNTYGVLVGNTSFCFFMDFKKLDKLIIMLPGAVNRNKGTRKIQRYTWADDFQSTVVSFVDTTVNEYNQLSLGWFQGESFDYQIPKLAKLIDEIICKANISRDKVLLFGSSAGGFSALQLSAFLKDIRIAVINPQIYLEKYSKVHFNNLLEFSYAGISRDEVKEKYNQRINVSTELQSRTEPIFYFQNTFDKHHMEYHLKPFITEIGIQPYLSEQKLDCITLSDERRLNVIYYEDESSGHSPPSKEETMRMLSLIF